MLFLIFEKLTIMKRHLILILTFCICTSIFAQTKQEAIAEIKKDLELSNKSLPAKFSFFTIYNMTIIENDFIVNIIVDEDQQDIDTYFKNIDKKNILSLVSGSHQNMTNLLRKAELNIRFVTSGNKSKRTRELFVSSDEIKKSDMSLYTPYEYLIDLINIRKKNLPIDIGDGMMISDMELEGQYLCYKIKTDESIVTMPFLMKAKENDLILGFVEAFNTSDDYSQMLLFRRIKLSNKGIKITYWSDKTSERVTVDISPDIFKMLILDRLQDTFAIAEDYARMGMLKSFQGDKKEAFDNILKSAEMGYPPAMVLLGKLYYNGDGVNKDNYKAAFWYEKAANLEDEFGQYILGLLYYNGIGVNRDINKSVMWLTKSANQGNKDAQNFLKKIK